MFRDDQQLARACSALLVTVRLERLMAASKDGADAVDDWLVERAALKRKRA